MKKVKLKEVKYIDINFKPPTRVCECCHLIVNESPKIHRAYLLFEDDAMNLAALYLSAEDFEEYECDVIAICKFDRELGAYTNDHADNYVNCITDDSSIFANLVRKAIGQEEY